MSVALLGPQRFEPTVADAAKALGVTGPIALVTAGWQEREPEDDQLSEHLGGRTVNLDLHRRGDEVFRRDPEFRAAYRARQLRLRQLQDFYRIRLEHLIESARVISSRAAPAELLAEEKQTSVEAIRVLDRFHLQRCQSVRQEFVDDWAPGSRPVVAEHREQVAKLLSDCEALAIAGGHVASVLNRLWLFGLGELPRSMPILAWSAGAMAVTERVVLFHDSPPSGAPAAQLLSGGLGLVTGIVALPNPEQRLALDQPERVAMYARRFSAACCLALPRRSWVVWQDGKLGHVQGVLRLESDGSVTELRGDEA